MNSQLLFLELSIFAVLCLSLYETPDFCSWVFGVCVWGWGGLEESKCRWCLVLLSLLDFC